MALPKRSSMELSPATPVAVEVANCSDQFAQSVRHLLVVELTQRRSRDAALVKIRCDIGGSAVSVSAERLNEADDVVKRSVRGVGLRLAARARLVALAAAELIAIIDQWPPAMEPMVTQSSAAGAQGAPHGLRLWLAGRAALLTEPTRGSFGGTFGASYDLSRLWGLRSDIAVDYGARSVSLGEVGALSISGMLSATLGYRVASWLRLVLGLGARLGGVRFHGSARDPETTAEQSFWDFWAGPSATLTLELQPTQRPLWGLLGLEAGYAVTATRAEAQESPAIAIDSFWLVLAAGVGWTL